MTDKQLARLISRRDRLASELASVEPRVRAAINEFSRGRGYMIPLRIEQVRPLVGLNSHGAGR